MKLFNRQRVSVFFAAFFLSAVFIQFPAFCLKIEADTGKNMWSPDSGREPSAGDLYINPRDGSVLVWIPGGRFIMGCDDCDEASRPSHIVKVEGFWLGKYPVTNRQYAVFLEETQSAEPAFWGEPEFSDPDQPVTGITYYEALSYCEWAGLRLPTEAEWEYAASGGKQFKYPTDNGKISHDQANIWGTGGRDIWLETPSPVGVFPPNPYGLYDMAGNVFEWTSSLYTRYPYDAEDGRESTLSGFHRVMRGGAWQFGPDYAATTYRHNFAAHLRYDYAGLRVAGSFSGR